MMLSKCDGFSFHFLQTCADHTHVGDSKIASVELWNFPFEKTFTMPKPMLDTHTHTHEAQIVLHTRPHVVGRVGNLKLTYL